MIRDPDPPSSSDNDERPSSLRNLPRRAKNKAKDKAKRVLHIDTTEGLVHANQDGGSDDVENNPAFNPQNVFHTTPVSVGDALQHVKNGVHGAAHAVLHPKDTAKRKAAAKLAMPEQPFLSDQADRILLEAHERLDAAQRSANAAEDGQTAQYEAEVKKLQDQRESLRVAWTTSRFVHRVRVLPVQYVEHPRFEDFEIRDADGNHVGMDWARLWGQCVLYTTQDYQALGQETTLDNTAFSRHLLIEHAERVLMASAPWQSYFFKLRNIYRWENPRKSAKWFLIFTVLWLVDYVLTFLLCYCVYIVLANRYSLRSVRSLRESHERTMDQGATAFKISELIHRHGSGQWLDPLVDELGPRAQVQLNDLADYLERLQNFYDWKFPEKTWASLFCIFSAIALGALTPTGYSMRVLTFVAIWWFFMGRPVASNYPRFRHTVSPISYVFWDLPTHAQWSFRYLGSKAQEMRKRTMDESEEGAESEDDDMFVDAPSSPTSSTPSTNDDVYFLTFRCRNHGVPGRLAISSDSISFLRLFPAKKLWSRHFHEIREMRKITGSAVGRGVGKILEGKTLEFTYVDGAIDQVEAVRKRDEAFNSIIGFSGLGWQMLDPLKGRNEEEIEGG